MSKRVDAWIDDEGALHKTELEADVANLVLDLEKEYPWMHPDHVTYDPVVNNRIKTTLFHLIKEEKLLFPFPYRR